MAGKKRVCKGMYLRYRSELADYDDKALISGIKSHQDGYADRYSGAQKAALRNWASWLRLEARRRGLL